MADKAADKFRREVALQYAADNKIDGITDNMTDKALQRVIKDVVGTQEFVCSKKNGGCTFPNGEVVHVRDDDKYCWRCGFDCSADGEGGYDNLFGTSKDSKVKTVDRTGETEESPTPRGKKDPAKKESAKKEPAKKDKKTTTTTTEVAKTEPEAAVIPLDKRVAEIRLLDASTGGAAWKIGQHFVEILNTEQFREGKYKDMDKFLEKELNMNRPVMQMYVRIAERFAEEEANQLSVFKLEVVGRAPDEKVRAKLLKAAIGGMDRKQLTDKLAESKEASGDEEKRGRPKKSSLSSWLGKKKRGKKEKGKYYICLDGADLLRENRVWVEIDIMDGGKKAELEFFLEDLDAKE